MKHLRILGVGTAVGALIVLGGCVAVPSEPAVYGGYPYYGGAGPAYVDIDVYSAPRYRGYRPYPHYAPRHGYGPGYGHRGYRRPPVRAVPVPVPVPQARPPHVRPPTGSIQRPSGPPRWFGSQPVKPGDRP